MIRIINDKIDALIRFINEKYPDGPDVYLHIIEDCDTIDAGSGVGFGVYDVERKEIYVAGDLPKTEWVMETIAHEFAHHLQNVRGDVIDEPYAEDFGIGILKELAERGNKSGEDQS